MAAHIEKLVLGCLLGLEFLMNIQVNTLRQKIKAPQLWSIHSVHSGQRGDQPHWSCRDLWWVCGCVVVALRSVLVTVIHPGGARNDSIDSDVKEISKQDFFFFFKHKHKKLFGTHMVASPRTGFLGRWATFWLRFCLSSASPKRAPLGCTGDVYSSSAHLSKHLE